MGSTLPKQCLPMEMLEPSKTQSSSSIEELPPELMYQVIEYAQASIYDLRLTSRIMKSRVDEWSILHQSIPIVKELRILKSAYRAVHLENRRPQDTNIRMLMYDSTLQSTKPGWMALKIIIPSGMKAKLFCLRLIRHSPRMIVNKEARNEYTIDFDANNGSILKYLRDCIGRRIEKVVIRNCNGSSQFAVCELLKGVQIEHICVTDRSIQPSVAERLENALQYRSIASADWYHPNIKVLKGKYPSIMLAP